MKKLALLLVIAALPLTACTQTSSSASTSSTKDSSTSTSSSSSSLPRTDILLDYATSFNAHTIVTTTTEGKDDAISSKYETYLGSDYLTMLSINETGKVFRTQYYEKSENKIEKLSLTKEAEIVRSEVTDFAYFDNVISSLGITAIEDGEYAIDVTSHLQQLIKLNYQLSSALTGTLDCIQDASFIREGDSLSYYASYLSNGIILTIETDFVAKEEESTKKLTVPSETEASLAFDSMLTELKKQNFTLEISENQSVTKTILSNADRLYYQEARTGYLKEDNGYVILTISDDETEAILNSEIPEEYETIQPDFLVDGRVLDFADSIYTPLPEVADIDTAFEFLEFNDLTNSELVFTLTEDELIIDSNEITYTFKDIGTTEFPFDFSDYTVSEDWTSQDPEILESMHTLLGEDIDIPYFNTGYPWYVMDSYEDYLDLVSEDVPSDQADALIQSYLSLLMKTSFTKFDREVLQPYIDSWDIIPYDEVNCLIFDLHNGYYMEVFNGYNTFLSGVGLSFNLLPEGLGTQA